MKKQEIFSTSDEAFRKHYSNEKFTGQLPVIYNENDMMGFGKFMDDNGQLKQRLNHKELTEWACKYLEENISPDLAEIIENLKLLNPK